MKKLLKNIIRIFKKIDISPIDRGGIIKGIIFIIWGLNAFIFIGFDNLCNEIYADQHTQCLICNITEILSTVEINVDYEITFDSTPVGTVPSYNLTLLPFEPIEIVRDRSPPNHIY